MGFDYSDIRYIVHTNLKLGHKEAFFNNTRGILYGVDANDKWEVQKKVHYFDI